MKTYDTLYKYFEKIYNHPLTADEKSVLEKSVRVEIFQKKQIVFSSGESGTKHYLIEKGLLRLFVIDQDGKEFNILFASENQWIGDLSSPAPTSFFLDAVEKTTVYSFSDESFRALTANLNSVTELIKKSYIFLQKRFVSILSKTAEENYDELCRDYPLLLRRLPQYHISSYLGVTPVFLSKILARKAKKEIETFSGEKLL